MINCRVIFCFQLVKSVEPTLSSLAKCTGRLFKQLLLNCSLTSRPRLVMQCTMAQLDSSTSRDYASAVSALNRLQSNAANIEQSLREKDARCGEKIPEMIRLAARLGITPSDYDSLRVIHITGTKGKGGTAAYTESILRCHGYRTGFYSSPHLVEVRERIRINGRPISREDFAKYFWLVHDRLAGDGGDLPAYFPFLTLMAVWVFLAEKLDVAVVEVGIGGRYDSTNFVASPWICAVSPLGLDHTALLGGSLAEIAWQKAGIFKPGCTALTVLGQPDDGLAVLRAEADKVGCPLLTASPASDSRLPDWLLNRLAPSQLINASLAFEICRHWLLRANADANAAGVGGKKALDHATAVEGLAGTRWPGRFDIMPYPVSQGITLYIDGAHTIESVTLAAQWFLNSVSHSSASVRKRKLLFNRTGDRRPKDLLAPLISAGFSKAAFCPNVVDATASAASNADLFSALASTDANATKNRVEENMIAFQQLDPDCRCRMFDSVSDALDWLASDDGDGRSRVECDVLVTGSLHLVGCLYAKLSPEVATGDGAD